MAYAVVWSEEALADIGRIADYIQRDSFPYYAAAVVERMIAAGESLSKNP